MSGVTDWSDDSMGREPSARFLTAYLLANPHVKVLNVNSPWGAGKSFFLNRWKADLSNEHVCVFFNAWETDYTAEPLIAMVTCIEQQTTDKVALDSTEAGKKIITATSTLMKKAAPLIAKGLVKKFTGVEVDAIFGKDASDGAGDIAKDVVESLIKEQSKTAVHVDDFKNAILERLSQAAENYGLRKPAFIFIDELDRCRPTYAIELLERVKHFFELEDCRFIVASDSTQLAHSVRAVYGEKFFSERYLSRFFDAEFRLDNSDTYAMAKRVAFEFPCLRMNIVVGGFANLFSGNTTVEPRTDTVCTSQESYPEYALILVGMAKYFKVELREMLRYAQQINSMASALAKHDFHYFWAAYLIFSKSADEDLYRSLEFDDKAILEIGEYGKNKAVPVTFTFRDGLESIAEIARLYVRALSASRESLMKMMTDAKGWRENVINEIYNETDTIRTYKKMVELAHRIS